VRLFNVADDEHVVSAVRLADTEDGDDENEAGGEAEGEAPADE
jgi:hypothetical protein